MRKAELTFIETIFILFIIIFPIFIFQTSTELRLINKRYNANYTLVEFIFAGDTIKDYLNAGKQQTINLRGDN